MTQGQQDSKSQDHKHPPFLAHHFDTPEQQFTSSKIGMWLFLVTEILLFGGLFCAYAAYRANHPEVFRYASQYLDTLLGGINTVVLIASSFTMAWAVHAAQKGQQRRLVILLTITLLCACGFLGIKYVEYKAKWEHGLLWGRYFDPHLGHDEQGEDDHGDDGHAAAGVNGDHEDGASSPATATAAADADPAAATQPGSEAATSATGGVSRLPGTTYPPPGVAPAGLAGAEGAPTRPEKMPRNLRVFFGVYFSMTGLHGLHVIAGMVVIAWLLVRARKGQFGPAYFTPVDLGGLYWHLVDLIWIYLFPLLYLI